MSKQPSNRNTVSKACQSSPKGLLNGCVAASFIIINLALEGPRKWCIKENHPQSSPPKHQTFRFCLISNLFAENFWTYLCSTHLHEQKTSNHFQPSLNLLRSRKWRQTQNMCFWCGLWMFTTVFLPPQKKRPRNSLNQRFFQVTMESWNNGVVTGMRNCSSKALGEVLPTCTNGTYWNG